MSEAEITDLVTSRAEALRASGRIEFGGGILLAMDETHTPYGRLLSDELMPIIDDQQIKPLIIVSVRRKGSFCRTVRIKEGKLEHVNKQRV